MIMKAVPYCEKLHKLSYEFKKPHENVGCIELCLPTVGRVGALDITQTV